MTKDNATRPSPSPAQGKRARTRATLVEAAAEVIREKGYAAVSMEAVAQKAGMSRGAIYGNFKDREALLLAVVQSRWEPVTPVFKPGGSFKEQMRILAKALIAALDKRRTSAVGAAAFQEYALTHEEVRRSLVELNREIYRRSVKALRAAIPDEDLPMPPAKLVRALHGMIEGFTLLRALTPELIGDDVIIAAFEALA
jgi:AcrR family transcriptional regulator